MLLHTSGHIRAVSHSYCIGLNTPIVLFLVQIYCAGVYQIGLV